MLLFDEFEFIPWVRWLM